MVYVPLWLTGDQSVSPVVFGLVLIASIFLLPRDRTGLDVIRADVLRRETGAQGSAGTGHRRRRTENERARSLK